MNSLLVLEKIMGALKSEENVYVVELQSCHYCQAVEMKDNSSEFHLKGGQMGAEMETVMDLKQEIEMD